MTKKDYELFANEIHNQKKFYQKDVSLVVEIAIRVFKQDNPLFQPDKFEQACYEGKHIRKSISGK